MSSVSNMSNSLLKFHAHDEQVFNRAATIVAPTDIQISSFNQSGKSSTTRFLSTAGPEASRQCALERKRKKETWWLDQKDAVEFVQWNVSSKIVDRLELKNNRSETDTGNIDPLRAACRLDNVVSERS